MSWRLSFSICVVDRRRRDDDVDINSAHHLLVVTVLKCVFRLNKVLMKLTAEKPSD